MTVPLNIGVFFPKMEDAVMNMMKYMCLSSLSFISLLVITPAFAQPFAYITNVNDNTVSIINTANNIVVDTVNVGDSPVGIAISPDGSFVYVANTDSNNVSVINTFNNTVVANVSVGAFPIGLAITPDGSFVYVTNANSHDISIIDTSTNTVVDTVGVGVTGQWGIEVSPDGSFVYASD